jgi:hypothetical protein
MREVTNWQIWWNTEVQKMINKNAEFVTSVQKVLEA